MLKHFLSVLAITLQATFLFSQSTSWATEPKRFELPLWENGAPGALGSEPKDVPKAIVQLIESETPAPVLVICPGGGYGGLAMDHEGYQFIEWANQLGMSAVICDYRHRGKGYGHPAPLQDAQRAIRLVRENAKKWNIDPNRVGIIGFSAGGHLVSTVLTQSDSGNAESSDPIARQSSRPDFGILCYPVIALGSPFTHKGSEKNLLGENPDPALLASLANEKRVTANMPPTFIMHTQEDTVVPPENALVFYQAMVANKVKGELHLYQTGPHGVGLAKKIPGTSEWPETCKRWLVKQEMIKP